MGNSIRATLKCLGLCELLRLKLVIPEYQRYYTWKDTHVIDLLKDIFDRKTPYLMGTVVLHKKTTEEETFDIIDGQQRLVTFTILLWELGKKNLTPLLEANFPEGSAEIIRRNRNVIREFLKGKAENVKDEFSRRLSGSTEGKQDGGFLSFSVLTLEGQEDAIVLDRAFTFFDSVNSKGMQLTDFNLLKAHHLMFMPPKQEALAVRHNEDWESRNEKHPDIFSTVLRRLRMWARGEDRDSRRERPDYYEFCSVIEPEPGKENEHELNRYMQPVAFRSWRRVGDRIVLSMDYPALEGEDLVPTEITQTIEGGDPFFIYAKRYSELYSDLFGNKDDVSSTEYAFIKGLAVSITNLYLQNAFRSVMVLYVDKFGEDRLIETAVCVERIVSEWRWKASSVRIEGTLSHVLRYRLIPIILDSVNSLHAYSQLLGICQKLNPVPFGNTSSPDLLKGVKKYYYESIINFYKNEKEKVHDNRVQEIIRSHYTIED